MELSYQQLLKIPVVSRDGIKLGVVGDIIIDAETGRLAALGVSTNNLVKKMIKADLIIRHEQIIEITPEQVTVESGEKSVSSSVIETAAV